MTVKFVCPRRAPSVTVRRLCGLDGISTETGQMESRSPPHRAMLAPSTALSSHAVQCRER